MKFLQEKMSTVHVGGEAGGLGVGSGRRQCGQFCWPQSRRGHPAEESAESLLRALGVGSRGSARGPGAPGRLPPSRAERPRGRGAAVRPFSRDGPRVVDPS